MLLGASSKTRGLVTAVIGDVAAIFGCLMGIKAGAYVPTASFCSCQAMGTAITFVALGLIGLETSICSTIHIIYNYNYITYLQNKWKRHRDPRHPSLSNRDRHTIHTSMMYDNIP